MKALIMTMDNPDETARWTQATPVDLLQLQAMAVREARQSGCAELVVRAHDGVELWRYAHGLSVEDDKRLESVLVWLGSPERR